MRIMYFPSKAILSSIISLLILSSSVIATDEKKNKSRLRGIITENVLTTYEGGNGVEDSHHHDHELMDVLDLPVYHNNETIEDSHYHDHGLIFIIRSIII